jgi:hypothetical protein
MFQGKDLPPIDICQKASAQPREYQNLNIHNRAILWSPLAGSSSHNIRWSPPPRGILKINVDVHLSSDGHWSSGMILRREDGSTVGAATRSHAVSDDAIMGEAMGLNAALDMAERYKAT